MNFAKADKWFSYYIRLKYANPEGIVKCYTCPYQGHWKKDLQNGHGIPRQHKATRFSEFNAHPQCKKCNKWEQGAQQVYKQNVDRDYGEGTWARLEIRAKAMMKFTQFELDLMAEEYKRLAKSEAQQKGLTI